MHPSLTYASEYQGLPINTGWNGDLPCRADILEALRLRFMRALRDHSKVLMMRLDLAVPMSIDHNTAHTAFVNNFMASFAKHLRRRRLDPHYVWVCEMSSNGFLHYHLVVALDGNRTWSIFHHMQAAERLWARTMGVPESAGLVDRCNNRSEGQLGNGIMIRRGAEDFQEKLRATFYRCSYLAKTSQKSGVPKTFGHSELKS